MFLERASFPGGDWSNQRVIFAFAQIASADTGKLLAQYLPKGMDLLGLSQLQR